MKYPNVVRDFTAKPWAITPEKLAALAEVVEIRASGLSISADVIAAHKAAAVARRAATPGAGGAVAVLPIYGTIAQRAGLMTEMSGGTACEQVSAAFDAALANPQVGAIVFDVDSPGGSVSGVPELAAKIRAARGQKPIVAVANTLMASAAYWIASACDEIVASPSADVGSIGVYQMHADQSEQLAADGVKLTFISAGKYKVEGNNYEPLGDEARANMQAQVDEWYGAFVGAVAKGRGISAATVKSSYGEGRVLTASQALAAGMVDRVATLDDVLADLSAGKGVRSVRRAADAALIPRAAAAAVAPAGDPRAEANVHLAANGFISATDAIAANDLLNSIADVPLATAGEAVVVAASPTLVPAAEARSNTVSTENAAANGAAPTNTREAQLRGLARMAGKDLAWLESAIDNGTTVEAAQASLFAERREAASPAVADAPRVSNVVDRAADRSFATFGEQINAVVQAGKPGGRVDPRLRRMAGTPSGMNESVGSEGGFFVQQDLLPGVVDPVYTEDPLVSRVTRIPIGAGRNGVKYNVVDETSRANGSRWGGMQMYWAAEADTAAASKPKLRQMQLDLKKVIGIGYLTEELMEDGVAAESLLTRAFQSELAFMLANGIFRGTGAGQMQGFLNSSAVVSQAIEASQTIANSAASISTNLTKMLARIPSSLWGSVIFLYNQEFLPTLVNATNGASGAVPLFMAAGGLADRPSDTILGRPAFASELCEAVGTPGDIIAIAPSEYHMADRGGAQQSQSAHVRFLYDEQTLKITYRTDGAPVWKQAVTPFKGAATRSPFVTLAARS